MADYNGLTRNAWTGTWSPSGDHPIVLDTEIRGGLRYVSGDAGDQLTDIAGQRLQEGMLVYVKNTYGSVDGNKFYQYSLLSGESRNTSTGDMPNAAGNWTEVTFGGSISAIGDIANVSSNAPSTGQVLKWSGTEWAPASDLGGGGGSGISLSDLSVSVGTAGTPDLSYNNVTGVFNYTPPDTDGVTEGSTNLYYTDARFDARLQTRNLGNLADVDTTGASDGQALAWSSQTVNGNH